MGSAKPMTQIRPELCQIAHGDSRDPSAKNLSGCGSLERKAAFLKIEKQPFQNCQKRACGQVHVKRQILTMRDEAPLQVRRVGIGG
jgi:hypothetical protein